MTKNFLLLNLFFVTFFTHSMETFETSPSIKRKLDEALQRFQKNISKPYLWAAMQYDLSHDYNYDVAKIVLTAGDEMCDLEKLEYLIGDDYYINRKKIIYNIIDNIKVENFDPCTICYQDTNPLEESIIYKDIEFTKYLLRSGAKPNKKAIELTMYPYLVTNQISEWFMLFEFDTSKIYELIGIRYKKNNFGDIFPLWQDIPQEELLSKLSQFVSYLDMIKGTPCIIEVPHSKAAVLDIIKQAGFTLFYANNDKTEWIFKNNSPIPLPFNAIIGTSIVVKKDDNMVLVIEEKTRTGLLEFPGGTAELKELPRKTAVRELFEEVNLSVLPDDLELFAIDNRTKDNRFNATAIHHYYTVNHDKISGILKPDNNEIIQAFYAPLQDIVEQKSIQGLSVLPKIAALAKHLKENRIKSYSQNFPEDRQLFKKGKFHNFNAIATIEFFAK